MHTIKNTNVHTTGRLALSMVADWIPSHQSLEAEAAELLDMKERDSAARVAFQRCKSLEH